MKQLYNYEYATPQVHQVTSITPPTEPGIISTNFQTVNSNSFNKVKEILENNNNYKIYYDNSQNRIKTELVNTNGNKKIKDKYYSAGYERELKYINNSTYTKREINYIEGPDGLVALFINNQNDVKNGTLYFVDKNHQCSIMALINEKTGEVKEYNYDPWGRRIDPKTNSYLTLNTDPGDIIDRGYTGHEYLPLFGLINMNGRMYDPVIGRVLSPDNYVQGGGVQGLNRYSYCGNNPVMFVDPDGQFPFLIIGLAIAGAYLGGVGSNSGELNPVHWNWKEPATYLGMTIGGIAGAMAGYGILNPRTVKFALGIGSGLGEVFMAGNNSNWSFQWTTSAGGGGEVPLNGQEETLPPIQRPDRPDQNSNVVQMSVTEAGNMAEYIFNDRHKELAVWGTDKGVIFDKTEGVINGAYYENVEDGGIRYEPYKLGLFGEKYFNSGTEYDAKLIYYGHTHNYNQPTWPDDYNAQIKYNVPGIVFTLKGKEYIFKNNKYWLYYHGNLEGPYNGMEYNLPTLDIK
ncbi:MAG: RHS repeat-associated core domain-containing protein [Bacteroidota bacterium]|nr:RHS repeat-associated core domain-containing protein [Bacteroidota bacterium]